jgi:hypothetical protein
MIATHCACCGRPLVDAASVETGVGPVCRKKYGFDADVSEEARKRANALVYALALAVSANTVGLKHLEMCGELLSLGFEKIAAIFSFRTISVVITEEIIDDRPSYLVRAPYNEGFNYASWCKGRFGIKRVPVGAPTKKKVFHWVLPKSDYSRKRLWSALVKHHEGALASANGKPFVIAPLKTAAQKAKEAARQAA